MTRSRAYASIMALCFVAAWVTSCELVKSILY